MVKVKIGILINLGSSKQQAKAKVTVEFLLMILVSLEGNKFKFHKEVPNPIIQLLMPAEKKRAKRIDLLQHFRKNQDL